ncbi:alpha/beta hydrolase [Nocardia salmonicida]|uniref:alpha/beta fold hydrolase n=1 Tax=Nocardia salmonicida TaxID=53431 RepID=UPI002E285B76|nr:alpha/beta hydrolase [Nocardia salmonicida]
MAVASAAVMTGQASAQPAAEHEFSTVVIPVGPSLLAARTIGQGPLVVLHPSLGRPGLDWDPVAELLADAGFQAVSFDPRGIGQSTTPPEAMVGTTLRQMADDMYAVVKHFGPRAHVAGHAFGNRVARMLAVSHPEVVSTVTLCAGGSSIPNPTATANLIAIANPLTPQPQFEAAVRQNFFAPGNDPTSWYINWYRPGMAMEEVATATTPGEEFESGGNAPMLVVQGMEDFVAPPAATEQLAQDYPDRVTRVEVENAGHALIDEQPDAIAAIMIDYLRAHPLG